MIPEVPGLPEASLVNRIVQRARRLARVALGPGLDQTWTKRGRVFSLSDPEPSFHARLTSGLGTASSPSRFRRVRLNPDGTWSDLTTTDDPALAYQANLQPTASGRIVVMRSAGLPEYRYFRPRSGGVSGPPGDCPPIRMPEPGESLKFYRRWYISGVLVRVDEYTLDWVEGPLVRVAPILTVGGAPIDVPGFWRISCQVESFSDEDTGISISRLVTWTIWPVVYSGVLWIGTIQSEVWADSYMDLTFSDPPSVRCAASLDHYAAGYPTDGISPGTVEGSVYDYWGCLPDAFGGHNYLPTGCTGGFALEFLDGIISSGADPPSAVDLCVDVHTPDCDDVLGSPIAGATISVTGPGILTPLTAMTNDAGRACVSVSHSGVYTVQVTHSSCPTPTSAVALVTTCLVPPVSVAICCGSFCLDLTGLFADNTTTAPLDGAVVTIDELPGVASATSDSSGRACITLNSLQMLALDPIPGTGCASRRANIRINKTKWVERCMAVDIPCPRTLTEAQADPTAVTLYGLTYPPPSSVDIFDPLPPALAHLCPPRNCSIAGWTPQGLVGVGLLLTLDKLEYEYYIDPYDHSAGTTWYNLRPTGMSGAVAIIDAALLDGTAVTAGHSPYGVAQRVEWRAFGTGNWEPRSGGGTYTTNWSLFVTSTGARLILTPVPWDPDAPDLPAVLDVPSGLPESPYLSTDGVMFHMDFTLDSCDFTGNGSTVTLTSVFSDTPGDEATTGRYRWTISWSLNLP